MRTGLIGLCAATVVSCSEGAVAPVQSAEQVDPRSLFVRPGDDVAPRRGYPIAGPKSQWERTGRGSGAILAWVDHAPAAFAADLLPQSEVDRCWDTFGDDETLAMCRIHLDDCVWADLRESGNVELTYDIACLREHLADEPLTFIHFTERAVEAQRARAPAEEQVDARALFVRPGDDAVSQRDYPLAGPKSQWVHVGRGNNPNATLTWVDHAPAAFAADLLPPSEVDRCWNTFAEDETLAMCSFHLADHISVYIRESGNVELTFWTELLRKRLADKPLTLIYTSDSTRTIPDSPAPSGSVAPE
jgi:hypothetical protein